MITKSIYVLVDILVIFELIYVIRALKKVNSVACTWLKRAMIAANVAIAANILVALSRNSVFAEISYGLYFASIDWILFFLSGFCMLYTEHFKIHKRYYLPMAVIITADSVSIFLNPLAKHVFYIYETIHTDEVFYQTGYYSLFYVHLALCYFMVLLSFMFIIHKVATTYGIYRRQYVLILFVLLVVVLLNLLYIALALVLDASVIFYGFAGSFIYLSITSLVPKALMNSSIVMAINDMNEGLILFDINQNLIYTNAYAINKFKHILVKNSFNFYSEPIISVVDSLKHQGTRFGEVPYVAVAENGDLRHFNIRYNKIMDKKNREIGTYFLVDDNTEQIKYMQELTEAREAADSANRAKSQFLANMSHEIRTPLNSVLGMNEMILRQTRDPQLIEYAQNIKASGDTLLSLINDILDFSKIEANKMEVINTEYKPFDVINQCYSYFEQIAVSKELSLEIQADSDLPSVLLGDDKKIKQILMNIISNALKYTKEGGVTIKAGFEKVDSDTINLDFTITDTGMGIAKKDISHLFDAFKRINEKQNATIQGTGLGLAITKELSTLMHGEVSVDSILGVGSSFKVTIPQKIVDSTPSGEFHKEKIEIQHKYHETFRAPEADVLVVDDVLVNLKVVTALLKKTELRIDTATGGREAMEMCNNKKYDVILLDHRMPEPDGIATFKVISHEGLNTETPVIALTANALNGAEAEYLDIGFSDYLSKPIRGEDLESTLLKYIPIDKVTLVEE